MLTVKWFTCGPDAHWCALDILDLSTATESGVYLIWHEGNPGRVVYAGQGAPCPADSPRIKTTKEFRLIRTKEGYASHGHLYR